MRISTSPASTRWLRETGVSSIRPVTSEMTMEESPKETFPLTVYVSSNASLTAAAFSTATDFPFWKAMPPNTAAASTAAAATHAMIFFFPNCFIAYSLSFKISVSAMVRISFVSCFQASHIMPAHIANETT